MNKSDFIFKYRFRNWPDYNRALVRRGSLSFWIDEPAMSGWNHQPCVGAGGRPRVYSGAAIECALVVKTIFR